MRILILASVIGCASDKTAAPLASQPLFWRVQFNQHAINLALSPPVNTFQLAAIPEGVNGQSLSGPTSTTFTTSDSSITVSASGLVTAHYLTSLSWVAARVTLRGVTLTDTAYFQVTQTPLSPPLKTFSIQPGVGDSANRAWNIINNDGVSWVVTATDSTNAVVCDSITPCPVLVYYSSSNPYVAQIDPLYGILTAVDTGRVVLRATTWAYGTVWQDSVAFTIGYGTSATIVMNVAQTNSGTQVIFNVPTQLVLGVGAVVTFFDYSNDSLNVVFDHPPGLVDSAQCFSFLGALTTGDTLAPSTGTGNIGTFGGDTTWVLNIKFYKYRADQNYRCRQFNTPGIYRYYSTAFPSDTFALNVR